MFTKCSCVCCHLPFAFQQFSQIRFIYLSEMLWSAHFIKQNKTTATPRNILHWLAQESKAKVTFLLASSMIYFTHWMTLFHKMNSISYQILLRTFPELMPGRAYDCRPRQNTFPKIGKYASILAIIMI